MSEPILAGTDGPPPATRAVEWAAADAARRRWPLRLVCAAEDEPIDVRDYVAPGGTREVLEERLSRPLHEAARLVRDRWPEVAVETELAWGNAVTELSQRSIRTFELVVGARGRGGIAAKLIGSTGLRLAQEARCPVVIVRGDEGYGLVTVGMGLRDDTAALDYAFDAARVRGARLRAVHVGEDSSAAGRLTEALGRWRERHSGVEVEEKVAEGRPASVLADLSAQSDLLVVAAHDRSGSGVPGLGSVAHGVAHHASGTVVIVR